MDSTEITQNGQGGVTAEREDGAVTTQLPEFILQRRPHSQKEVTQLRDLEKNKCGSTDKSVTSHLIESMTCSGECLKKKVLSLFPFIELLRTYQFKKWILYDILSGINVGAIHVPQSMGFALLTAVSPVHGLYTSFVVVLLYFFFGTSRHISVGTMAVTSLMIGVIVDREYDIIKDAKTADMTYNATDLSSENRARIEIAMSVSLLVGAFQVLFSILRLGIIANYMSPPFVRAFLAGAACHIVTTQVPFLLGIRMKTLPGIFRIPKSFHEIFTLIKEANPPEIICTFVCMTFLIVCKEIINVKCAHRMKAPIPAELIVLVVAILASFYGEFEETYDFRVIGYLPKGFPAPAIPPMPNFSTYILESFIIALVGFTISITMAKMMSQKHKYKIDINQELLAYGLSNGLASFFYCFAGTQAPPRTIIHERVGGKTQVASLVSCAIILVVILFLGPSFQQLPNSALASIITVALFPLFTHFLDLKQLWLVNIWDFIIWVVTFLSCLILDMTMGLFIGLAISIFVLVLQAQVQKSKLVLSTEMEAIYWAEIASVEQKKFSSNNIKIFKIGSSLFYATSEKFKEQLLNNTLDNFKVSHQQNGITSGSDDNSINAKPSVSLKAVVLDCSVVTYIDIAGLNALKALHKMFCESSVLLTLCCCSEDLIRKMDSIDLKTSEGTSLITYPTVIDAISALQADVNYMTYL